MSYDDRLRRFQTSTGENADVVFFPISADLQYLTGVPRDIPNFGTTIHPGAWLEGAWLTPKHPPILLLARMTAELGGLGTQSGIDLRVLGDFDDPETLVRDIFKA